MGSPQKDAATEASNLSRDQSRKAFAVGIPALARQRGILNQALEQGEPGYVSDAYSASRALLGDQAAGEQAGELQAQRLARHKEIGGGNFAAGNINPAGYGAKLANAMFSNRISEASGNVEQMDKLLGFQLGLGQDAGNSSMQSASNNIGAIPYMKNYNSTYANVLGALNAASSIYGAGKSGGWFDSPNTNGMVTG